MNRKSFLLNLCFLLLLTACTFVSPRSVTIIIQNDVPTAAVTVSPSATVSRTPTVAPTATNTASATTKPSNTPSPSPSPSATASLTVSATASPTATGNVPTATTNTRVNIRLGPATSFGIVRTASTGEYFTIIGISADGLWVQTSEGWLSRQYLTVSGSLDSLPQPTPTQETGFRIGYNINGEGVPSMSYLLETVSNPCGTLQLVMNNLSLARQIKDRCPDTRVVSRNYCPCEGDEWALRSPQQIVAVWIAEGNRDIIRYSTNEPSFGRGRRLGEFVAKEVELMKLARAAGFTVAMGNFSVGIFEPEDIKAGLFDPYIRALYQYGHYLALHEYSVAVLPFGVGRWSTAYLLDRAFVQPSSWPRAAELPTCPNGQLGSYWYLMRGTWWLCRADTIGVPRPRILVTEFGWDNLPNIKSQIEPLRQEFGIDRYFDDMRGVNTYSRLWAYYWPQWSFAQAACEQLKWADSVYPPEFEGFAMFAWNINTHWLQADFSGFENPQHQELHDCLKSYAYSLN